MSEKDPRDILARKNQQQGTLGTNRARMCSRRDRQAQMELDRTHFAEANIWHNQAGPGMESTRQKEGGKTSENLEEVSRRGAQTSQHHLEYGKKKQPQTESAGAVQCPPFVPRGTQWSNY